MFKIISIFLLSIIMIVTQSTSIWLVDIVNDIKLMSLENCLKFTSEIQLFRVKYLI